MRHFLLFKLIQIMLPSRKSKVGQLNCVSQRTNSRWIAVLFLTLTIQIVFAAQPIVKDEDLGTIVNNTVSLQELQSGLVEPSSETSAALSDTEKRRKEQITEQYNNGRLSLVIDSIYPKGGPTTGETRVLVRGGPFQDMHLVYPKPKCKFGKHDMIVDATYVTCTKKPLTAFEKEGQRVNRDDYCIQCESSPPNDKAEIVNLMISLTGDFTDSDDSEQFRYYTPPKVYAIYPRYGRKDGNTLVEVWGENFLNFDIQTRCGFGSKTVQAHFISSTYMTCLSPPSDVVSKAIPFTISMNSQQNTRDDIQYWYYNQPVVSQLVPNYGHDRGGNQILLKGSNFYPFDFVKDINNSNDTFCYFEQEGIYMPMRVNSSTTAWCEAPPNVMKIDSTFVEIALNNRDFTDDEVRYFYYRPSKITNIDPREGPTRGGTVVMVFGLDFQPGKKIICRFGDTKTRGKFISMGQIKCLSPPFPTPGIVPLSIAYDGEDDKFYSESFDYLYYETPQILKLEPPCGPVTGYTQITIIGRNFIDMGFGKVKCSFNNTLMNATIVNEQTIKCSSPRLSEEQESIDTPYLKSFVKVTLNGREFTLEELQFNYYPELKITKVNRNNGPVTGNTKSIIEGENFNHPHCCNLTVRYGAIEVVPTLKNDTFITISPQVAVPDAVTLSPSGNGQNFAPDYTLHYRDIQNTFTYMQDIFVQDIRPRAGPSTGGSKMLVRGYGIQQFKFENGTTKLFTPFVRFVDKAGNVIGHKQQVTNPTAISFNWVTPAALAGTQAIMQISYNEEYWQSLLFHDEDHTFVYYSAPDVYSIVPRYGPVKVSQTATINGRNFECSAHDPACQNLFVRFGNENNGTTVPGILISDQKIQVQVPAFTKPDVLPIEISFNGAADFTNSNLTYGYFDPFIIRVEPTLIRAVKTCQITVHGFGFINPDNQQDLRVKFIAPDGEVTCNGQSPCIVPATYIDKNTIITQSILMSQISHADGTLFAIGEPLYVEVSLVGDTFTHNKISIYYYDDPIFKNVPRDSVPKNLDQPIMIETDFKWDINSFPEFSRRANFTCMFTVGDESIVTLGRMETVPFGAQYQSESTKQTHVSCQTPLMHNSGKGTLKISANGQDFSGDLAYEFQVNLDLYRVLPQCGPNEGQTKVKLMGFGFSSQKDTVYSKFGVIAVQELQKNQVQNMAWSLSDWLSPQLMTEGDLRTFEFKEHKLQVGEALTSIVVPAPNSLNKNMGGPVYVSVGQNIKAIQVDQTDQNATLTSDQYYYTNSLVEYYYYKSPQVRKVEPNSGLTNGGTPIEISGAWFDYKVEYGLIPHCKIGEKVVRASFHSTVRIICTTPPNDYIYAPLPIKVSLNGVDWVDTGFTYSYYEQCQVSGLFPKAGQMNGGTEVFVLGNHFSNITDRENSKCKWTLIDNTNGIKRDRIIQYTPATFMNTTQMMCITPSRFIGGDRAFIQLTFNNKDYTDQDENLIFQFFSILGSFPHSGPANAFNEVILIHGAGFDPKAQVECYLNQTNSMAAVEVTENLIKCPMVWPGKNPRTTGAVKFSMRMNGAWTQFGSFFYYTQIELNDVYPRNGPAEGHGIVYLYGDRFRDDFPNVQLGCKIGDSVGLSEMIDPTTMRCVVQQMDLVNEGESLPVMVSLNSYSWVGENNNGRLLSSGQSGYIPYGIQTFFPESGIMEGFTDIFVTGKGFAANIADKAKCRFGVDNSYAVTDAEVLDYTKLVCRSPEAIFNKVDSGEVLSVPFSISFGEQENKPWTQDLHRYRFYKQPYLAFASPDEIDVRKKAEIYVYPEEGYSFLQPVPTGRLGMSDYHGTGGVSCSFGKFGSSMGMYLNQTTMLCLSPHITGNSDDYHSETVTVGIAFNGQDFLEETSNAQVTFIGTGSGANAFFHFVLTALLLALLMLAIFTCCIALWNLSRHQSVNRQSAPNTFALRTTEGSRPLGALNSYNISYSQSRQQNRSFRGSSQI